jgi:phosphoribosylformylglycinamidine synthase subunit PurQ / glutaminase
VRIGVVTFPGSLDDQDAARAVRYAGARPVALWHADRDLRGVDAVILPGGFSYGDYLRCGAIARFSPVMSELVPAARAGLPVLGICNGFQILCEAHLLPGALTRNAGLRFVTRDLRVRVENAETAWTRSYSAGQQLLVPLKSGEGAYVADPATLASLEAGGRVVVRYSGASPNGSSNDIAGICDDAGTVVGLMPHPEHAVAALTGPSADGLGFFTSVVALAAAGAGPNAAQARRAGAVSRRRGPASRSQRSAREGGR